MGFWIWVLGSGVWGLEFGVRGSGFGVWGLEFVVSDVYQLHSGFEAASDVCRVRPQNLNLSPKLQTVKVSMLPLVNNLISANTRF